MSDLAKPKMRPPEAVRIFDTTLRDGEQSPGASLTVPEKLKVARQLAPLGVDVIEAGFPAASPGDLDAVKRMPGEVGPGGVLLTRNPSRGGIGHLSEGLSRGMSAMRALSHIPESP